LKPTAESWNAMVYYEFIGQIFNILQPSARDEIARQLGFCVIRDC